MTGAPRYEEGTLADILPGALTSLGMPGLADRLGLAADLDGVRKVAVLLIDGMGWAQLPAMAPHAPLIASVLSGQTGKARQTTCGFPSTTPTSLISLNTGGLPGAHGVLAFTTLVPGQDRVLNHTKWTDDPKPTQWQPLPPLYEAASAAGIECTVVNRPEYIGSGLSVVTTRGAAYVPATGVDEVAAGMLAALGAVAGRGLVYGYHPELDKAGHERGLGSEAWAHAAADVDRLLRMLTEGLPEDAALIVTADHGQLDVPQDRRIDLDVVPEIARGVRLAAGEPRVRYLHTFPGAEQEVLAACRELAGHAAWVGTREEAVATGWYGPVSEQHAARLGDVILVCREDYALFAWQHDPKRWASLVAMHGALTPAELEIPLLLFRRT